MAFAFGLNLGGEDIRNVGPDRLSMSLGLGSPERAVQGRN